MMIKGVARRIVFLLLIGGMLWLIYEINTPTLKPLDDLSSWVGEYEYLYSSNPGGQEQKVVMYQLSITRDNDRYDAVFTVEGWQTFYKAKAIVKGNSDEISVIYDKYLDGSGWTFADSTTSSQDRFKNGDVLFEIIKTETGLKTKLSDEIAPLVHDVDFYYVG